VFAAFASKEARDAWGDNAAFRRPAAIPRLELVSATGLGNGITELAVRRVRWDRS